jgi:tetratricopeptide (TPR) repeat protein
MGKDMNLPDRSFFLICLILTGMVLACYYPVGSFGFIHLDDNLYLLYNSKVKAGLSAESVSWAFSNFEAANWHPVTWLSLMLDVELFGVDPGASHWVNVGFHLANTLLLFWLLYQATGARWRSAVVAALFAIHPLHVESVAWISERKDVLSTFWGLLSLLAYVSYGKTKRRDSYLLCILLLGIGLMAKPMLVTFPFVMLLLDYWPLKRFHPQEFFIVNRSWPLLREKIPFFVMAAAASAVTIAAQASTATAIRAFSEIPLSARIANAALSYLGYLGHTLWPFDLSIYYPHPGADINGPMAALAAIVLVGVSAGALMLHRHRYFFTGWFWYLGTLVPVIGIVQVGPQAMADRYTYIPLIGIFLAAAWGIGALGARGRIHARILAVIAVGSIIFFGVRTHAQVQVWENDFSLFGHALAVNEENHMAHVNMGNAHFRKGEWAEAKAHYLRALELNPRYLDALNNLGVVLTATGDWQEAERVYGWLLEEKPDDPTLHYNLGLLLVKQGRDKEAIGALGRAAELRPGNPAVYNEIGLIFIRRGNRVGACRFFNLALQVQRNFSPAVKNKASFCLEDAKKLP